MFGKQAGLRIFGAAALLFAAAYSANSSSGKASDNLTPPAPLVINVGPDGTHEFYLRVMTFNIAGLPQPIRRTRSDALRLIGEELRKMRANGNAPHVLVVQEAFTEEGRGIGKQAGYAYERFGPDANSRAQFAAAGPMPRSLSKRYVQIGEGMGKYLGSGLAVYSDLPIADAVMTAYGAQDCTGTDCLANKGAVMTHLALPGLASGIDILTTHMNSFNYAENPYGRMLLAHKRQSDVLAQFVKSNGSRETPMIVAGDFNASWHRASFDYLANKLQLDEMFDSCAQMADCSLDLGKIQRPYWQASLDLHWLRPGSAAEVIPLKINWAFDRPVQGALLSDHKAVMVTYRIRWKNDAIAMVKAPKQRAAL